MSRPFKKNIMFLFVFTVLFFLSVLSIPAVSNDTALDGTGDNLFPLENTDINILKEDLVFDIQKYECKVKVTFTFFNPGKKKTFKMGFVTPPISETIGSGAPNYEDFRVIVNGVEVSYSCKQIGATNFISYKKYDGYDYIYYFDCTFLPGENNVIHTYTFSGFSNSIGSENLFLYRITTVKYWKNKQVDDFTLKIIYRYPDFNFIKFPFSFNSNDFSNYWRIYSNNYKNLPDYYNNNLILQLSENSGPLAFVYHKKNFSPDTDMVISLFSGETNIKGEPFFESGFFKDLKEQEPFYGNLLLNLYKYSFPFYENTETFPYQGLSKMNSDQLRLARNFLFALKGYAFKSSDLDFYFSKFSWYKKNKETKIIFDDLSDREKNVIIALFDLENQIKIKNNSLSEEDKKIFSPDINEFAQYLADGFNEKDYNKILNCVETEYKNLQYMDFLNAEYDQFIRELFHFWSLKGKYTLTDIKTVSLAAYAKEPNSYPVLKFIFTDGKVFHFSLEKIINIYQTKEGQFFYRLSGGVG